MLLRTEKMAVFGAEAPAEFVHGEHRAALHEAAEALGGIRVNHFGVTDILHFCASHHAP